MTYRIVTLNEVLKYLRELGKHPGGVDIGIDIIASHLQQIGARALIVKDPEILKRLVDLGVLKAEK